MPFAAPVTTATLPSNRMLIVSLALLLCARSPPQHDDLLPFDHGLVALVDDAGVEGDDAPIAPTAFSRVGDVHRHVDGVAGLDGADELAGDLQQRQRRPGEPA